VSAFTACASAVRIAPPRGRRAPVRSCEPHVPVRPPPRRGETGPAGRNTTAAGATRSARRRAHPRTQLLARGSSRPNLLGAQHRGAELIGIGGDPARAAPRAAARRAHQFTRACGAAAGPRYAVGAQQRRPVIGEQGVQRALRPRPLAARGRDSRVGRRGPRREMDAWGTGVGGRRFLAARGEIVTAATAHAPSLCFSRD